MLDATRLRTPCLFDKIVSADEAATLITDGMNVGVSGFTPSGYPKKTTLALAKAIKAGKKCRINIWSGASVGPEIEETLAEVGGISGRMPYYAASNKTLSRQINTGSVTYIDQHLSHFAQQIDYGFYGDVDVAIVEAAAINADGSIVLGSGVGNTPMLVKHAKKIIVAKQVLPRYRKSLLPSLMPWPILMLQSKQAKRLMILLPVSAGFLPQALISSLK